MNFKTINLLEEITKMYENPELDVNRAFKYIVSEAKDILEEEKKIDEEREYIDNFLNSFEDDEAYLEQRRKNQEEWEFEIFMIENQALKVKSIEDDEERLETIKKLRSEYREKMKIFDDGVYDE